MPGRHAITPAQLFRLIGTADRPLIVDLRIPEDRAEAPGLIPGSIVHRHDDPDGLRAVLGYRAAILVCHKGLKISQGVAAWLRSDGVHAEVLEGGHVAWREAGLPLVPAGAVPPLPSLWVTRHRPKIDRIACPWLIRRFVDARARFLFVPPGDVAGVADRFGATAFDTEGAPFAHQEERCTFDAMLDAFGLDIPALRALADIVRAADLDSVRNAPQAAGLLAFSVGLSRLHRDDNAQLDAAMPLYDALYRWARDGQDETHGHPA